MAAEQKIEEGNTVLMLKNDPTFCNAFSRLLKQFRGVDLLYTEINREGKCTIQVYFPRVGKIDASRKAREGILPRQRLYTLIKDTLRKYYRGGPTN